MTKPTKTERYLYTCENCGEYDPETVWHRAGYDISLCTDCTVALDNEEEVERIGTTEWPYE